jgi:hypothetical protein
MGRFSPLTTITIIELFLLLRIIKYTYQVKKVTPKIYVVIAFRQDVAW